MLRIRRIQSDTSRLELDIDGYTGAEDRVIAFQFSLTNGILDYGEFMPVLLF